MRTGSRSGGEEEEPRDIINYRREIPGTETSTKYLTAVQFDFYTQ